MTMGDMGSRKYTNIPDRRWSFCEPAQFGTWVDANYRFFIADRCQAYSAALAAFTRGKRRQLKWCAHAHVITRRVPVITSIYQTR